MSYVSLNSKTIKSILEDINVNKYLLSSIRREFIWSTVKIEKLFDSLMRDYLINSFLFWQVRGEGIQNYKFYEFLRNDISQEELEVLINMDKDIKIEIKGTLGEARQEIRLHRLDREKYKSIHDIIIPNKDKTAQIDHLVVSNYGIFVIENKNFSGNIWK